MPFSIVIAACLAIPAGAQTVTTNWVEAPPNLREVNGKLYNIEKSTNWIPYYGGRCLEVLDDGILVETGPEGNPYVGGRDLSTLPRVPGGITVFLKNYPTNFPAAIGDHTKWGKVMSVGVELHEGQRVQTYDWGLPHRIAIIKTNAVTALK